MFLSIYFIIRQNLPNLSQFKRYMLIQKHKNKYDFFKQSPQKRLASPKILTKFSPLANLTTSKTT